MTATLTLCIPLSPLQLKKHQQQQKKKTADVSGNEQPDEEAVSASVSVDPAQSSEQQSEATSTGVEAAEPGTPSEALSASLLFAGKDTDESSDELETLRRSTSRLQEDVQRLEKELLESRQQSKEAQTERESLVSCSLAIAPGAKKLISLACA